MGLRFWTFEVLGGLRFWGFVSLGIWGQLFGVRGFRDLGVLVVYEVWGLP